ncbi:MAG TPA: carboxypeptidase-like regulatory domain-containing protein [Thermoanaerobaculia bacterium]|nr:carboxypeptidase-like regulatory domain-containing protein [Thermoanaerobaculia bacterium]
MKRLAPLLVLSLLLPLLSACERSPTDPFGSRSSVSGIVSDKYNRVVALADVSFLGTDGQISGLDRTGDDGKYKIYYLRPGHYKVLVYLGRTAPVQFEGAIDLQPGENIFDIVTR